MKMKNIAASLLATLSFVSASAMAASYDVTINGLPSGLTSTDFSSNLSFSGFDANKGNLTGVTISLSGDVVGTVDVWNMGSDPVSGSVSLDLLFGLNGSTILQKNLYNESYTALNADATISFAHTTSFAASNSYSGDLSYFKHGTVSGVTTVKALATALDGEGTSADFTTQVAVIGKVTYTYAAPVPEPETYGMMLAGLALVGVVARRKRASIQA